MLIPPLWMLEHEKMGHTCAGSRTSLVLVEKAFADAKRGRSIAFFILKIKN
jgi:hypothetical protein